MQMQEFVSQVFLVTSSLPHRKELICRKTLPGVI